MKAEIKNLNMRQLRHENFKVASELRINGVPSVDAENLYQMLDNLCETINITTPSVKSIYRVNNVRNHRNVTDAVIMVNLNTPYEKNIILKNFALFRKSNKSSRQLKHVGFDSDKPIYICISMKI